MSSGSRWLLLALMVSLFFGMQSYFGFGHGKATNDKYADSLKAASQLHSVAHTPDLAPVAAQFDLDRLRHAGFDSPERLSTIKIRDIRVGMRVPAHNPQMTDTQRAAEELKIDPTSWRKFTLEVDKEDGSGKVKVTLLRPSTWLVDEIETTSLALLENLIAEAEAEEQAKSESLDHEVNGHVAVHSVKRMQSLYTEIQETLSTESLLETAGQSIIGWVNTLRQLVGSGDPLSGLARFSFGRICDQLSEDQRLEEAYWDAADEIQAGDGIGSVVWLDMPELGAVGFARVVGNDSCPDSLNGPGQVVTATFVHESAKVLDLVFQPTGVYSDDSRLFPEGTAPTLENSSRHKSASSTMDLGVTTAHPFWSVTRNGFIPAGELRLFEQVVTIDGQIWRLTSITPRAGPETVYNFEVAREHVYYVGSDGLLVHNVYVYAVFDNVGQLVYAGIGKGARRANAMTRVAKKLGTTESALRASGYIFRSVNVSKAAKMNGFTEEAARRGLEQILISRAKAAGRNFTARGVKDGNFVNNTSTFLNKINSYKNNPTYDAAGQALEFLLKKFP